MKYQTQKLAYPYFILATLLFGLQVIFGLLTGAKYVWNVDPLIHILPFNVSREIHHKPACSMVTVWFYGWYILHDTRGI